MASPRRTRALPPNPSIEQHKKQAKELLKAHRSHDPAVLPRLRSVLASLAALSDEEIWAAKFQLSDAQFVIAREHGFDSWPKFQRHVEKVAAENQAKLNLFLKEATPVLDQDHRSGTARAAADLLAAHPELQKADIYS